jgi:hypothetical protein
MKKPPRLSLCATICLLVAVIVTPFLVWATLHHEMVVLQVFQHLAFVIWSVFVFWFGVRRRWEATTYGINTFLVSLGIWLLLFLVQTSILWPDAAWRPFLRVTIYVLITVGGIQRLMFLWRETHRIAPKRG